MGKLSKLRDSVELAVARLLSPVQPESELDGESPDDDIEENDEEQTEP